MTDPERAKILKMIDDGKITAEEGLRLMQVLDDQAEGNDNPDEPTIDTRDAKQESSSAADPEIARTVETARSLWMIPTGIGIAIILFGAWVMWRNILPETVSAWFYCLGFPIFAMGILVTIIGVGSRTARWLFVSVKQKPGDFPKRILLGFPLPLALTSWFLRTFGHKIKEIGNAPVDLVVDAISKSDAPLVVNVDEGKDGEKVQVYIG